MTNLHSTHWKQGLLSSDPRKMTKMTKIAGVTQAKTWFRNSRVCSFLEIVRLGTGFGGLLPHCVGQGATNTGVWVSFLLASVATNLWTMPYMRQALVRNKNEERNISKQFRKTTRFLKQSVGMSCVLQYLGGSFCKTVRTHFLLHIFFLCVLGSQSRLFSPLTLRLASV